MAERVRIDERDAAAGTWRIVLDDPDRANALGAEMVAELHTACERALDAGAKALVFTSGGTRFCAGFGMDGIETATDGGLRDRFIAIEMLLDRVRRAPAVTIACVDGPAIGAGADLVAACDYRIGTARARFAFPGVRFGVVLGTRTLVTRAGSQRALQILLEGESLDAHAALECGILSELVENSCDERVADIAHAAGAFDAATLRAVLDITRTNAPQADLAALVHSMAVPGLAERVREHARRVAAARAERKG